MLHFIDTQCSRLIHELRSSVESHKRGRIASFGLVILVVALPGFALWSATTTYQLGRAAEDATNISAYVEEARFAISEEHRIDRRYRLKPMDTLRVQHQKAADGVIKGLSMAFAYANKDEQADIKQILKEHEIYLQSMEELYRNIESGKAHKEDDIELYELDPIFNTIERPIHTFATLHRAYAQKHFRSLTNAQRWVMFATPLVTGLGTALMLLLWRTIRAYQQQAQKALTAAAATSHKNERRLHGLVQNTADVILICDQAGQITYQSPSAETQWSFKPDELLTQTILERCHKDEQALLATLWTELTNRCHEKNAGTRTLEFKLKDGANMWRDAELIATNLLADDAVHGIVITVRDLTQQKVFEHQLSQQAFYDAVTTLPNRILFKDRIDQAMVRADRHKNAVGLLFIDLDNFKLVNDSLGHQVGDLLLTEAASRLRTCVRAQDTVARLGGDEFVIILEQIKTSDDTIPVAEAIAHQFSRPFSLDGRDLTVTASVGIAVTKAGGDLPESLLRDADIAMYHAKAGGRDGYAIFNVSMQKDSLARLELESDLRHAVENNELRIHYQPIVNMETNEYTEVEALVRWQHPTRGMVQPNDFIPLAEETGIIVPLGLWVLEESCRQVVKWQKQFSDRTPPLVLSVNLSPRQFKHACLVDDVANALAQTGLAPHCLKLEITEGVIMQDVESTIKTLQELKNLGIKLAIDDFGTGYSSLAYLKRLPLDVLKIDRSFISGIDDNQEDTAIVHAILALAKSLNLSVTGEGIETQKQATLLGDWGCHRGQGYLYSRPLDSNAITNLLRDTTPTDDNPSHQATAALDNA